MKSTFLFSLSLSTFLPFFATSQCLPASNSIATSYTSNNGSRGAMFDLTATNTVTVTCFDANLYAGTAVYEIYYKAGSYIGNESNAAAWTFVGSATVTSLGAGLPTPLPIPVNIAIPAGQTCSFYVTNTVNGGVNYTTSAAQGLTLASDASLTMTGGVGKVYPFLTTFSYRLFNGTVHYIDGLVALPVEMTAFYATPLNERVRLNWQTETEVRNDHFTIGRSSDGLSWQTVKTIKGAVDSNEPIFYETFDDTPLPGISYYRISQTDTDGQTTFCEEIRSVNRTPVPHDVLMAYPNPAGDAVTIAGTADELDTIRVFSLFGQELTDRIPMSAFAGGTMLDLTQLQSGMMIVKNGDRSVLIQKD